MIVEMEEMASRPFATAVLEIERRVENIGAEKKDPNPDLRKRKRVSRSLCYFFVQLFIACLVCSEENVELS